MRVRSPTVHPGRCPTLKADICDLLPVPDLLRAGSLLLIQPHPDDMEIGAGATVARFCRADIPVTCLTVTDGSAGTFDTGITGAELAKIRLLETEKSASILGVKDLLRLDHPDGGTLDQEQVRAGITRAIRRIRPAAVMVCDPWLPYEAHSDHVRTGLAAAEACLLSNMPRFCPDDLRAGLEPYQVDCVAFYYTAYPNTFVDAGETWGQKMAALDCHASQFAPDQLEMFKAFLRVKAQNLGADRGFELAEAFKVLSTFHLHILEEAWQC